MAKKKRSLRRKPRPVIEFYETSRQMTSGRMRREYSWRLLAINRRIECVPGESFVTKGEAMDNVLRCQRDFRQATVRWAKAKEAR